MQQPLQITFRGLDRSEALEARIRERAEQLERFHPGLTSCHVTVEAPHHHHHKGNLYTVRLDVRVPGGEVVVNRDQHRDHSHEDPYIAIRDAFDAAVRQLQDHARHRRSQVERNASERRE